MNKSIEDIIGEWEVDCQIDSLALDDSITSKYFQYK